MEYTITLDISLIAFTLLYKGIILYKERMTRPSISTSTLILFLTGFLITTISIPSKSKAMAEETPQTSTTSSPPGNAAVYIVYTEEPAGGAEPESFHLRTLSSVLGSDEAAKDSLLYVYKHASTGFSAKLTPEQVSELEKQPGVLQVVRSQTLQLHSGGGAKNMMT